MFDGKDHRCESCGEVIPELIVIFAVNARNVPAFCSARCRYRVHKSRYRQRVAARRMSGVAA